MQTAAIITLALFACSALAVLGLALTVLYFSRTEDHPDYPSRWLMRAAGGKEWATSHAYTHADAERAFRSRPVRRLASCTRCDGETDGNNPEACWHVDCPRHNHAPMGVA